MSGCLVRAVALAIAMVVGAGLGRATCAPEVRLPGVTEVEHYR